MDVAQAFDRVWHTGLEVNYCHLMCVHFYEATYKIVIFSLYMAAIVHRLDPSQQGRHKAVY